jgi:RNA polymerase sigma factor (sigma-70 family)
VSDFDSGERRAWFRREVLPLEPELHAFAERLARPGQTEPADLVNDVMVAMIRLENWRSIDCPVAYAKRVLRNLAAEAARRSKIVQFGGTSEEIVLGLIDDAPDAEAVMMSRDELRRLQETVAAMPEAMRRAFTLRKVYGLSPPQIAEQLGVSISSVEKYLTKGLRICSERLARDIGGYRRKGVVVNLWAKARDRGGSE